MWGNKSDSSLPLDLGRLTSYDKRVTWLRNLLEVTLGLVKTRDVEERNPRQGEQN